MKYRSLHKKGGFFIISKLYVNLFDWLVVVVGGGGAYLYFQ